MRLKKFFLVITFVFLILQTNFLISIWGQTDPDKIVISIGEKKLTANQVNRMLHVMPPQQRSFFTKTPFGRNQFSHWIIRTELFKQEAEKRKLQNQEEIKKNIEKFKKLLEMEEFRKQVNVHSEEDEKVAFQIFLDGMLAKIAESEIIKEIEIKEEKIKQHFEDHLDSYTVAKGRRITIRSSSANHFYNDSKPRNQIRSDEEARKWAQTLRKKILEGSDFEEIAAKHSDDPTTSGVGGDLGIVRRGRANKHIVTPPELDILFTMNVGSISQVLEAPFGFVILKLEEKRMFSLEEARKEIEDRLRSEKLEINFQKMKEQTRIMIDEVFFNTSSPKP